MTTMTAVADKSLLHTTLQHLNDSILGKGQVFSEYDNMNETAFDYYGEEEYECFYEETQLERARYEEEGFYDLEIFTHYLSGFGGLTIALIGLAMNTFCAFTLCRAAVFRAHLVFLCAVAIADALQLSCLIVIITRDIRKPDPRYLNLLPRIYIRAFLYLYPLSKFFHLTMAWFVMAATIDCWRWMSVAHRKDQSRHYQETDNRARCGVIIGEVMALVGIALLALIYTIPAAWENKGDVLKLGRISTETNCSAYIYHLMQTDLSQTALYRIGYSLLGHLVFQTGIPLVASSIAIAKISRQLQMTSSSLGQLVTEAVRLMVIPGAATIDHSMPGPTYAQRSIVENRNIIHCSLFLSVFTFYVCHVPQLWAKIQWSLMHVESHQNSHMKYVNEFVNFMTVANASVNGFFLLCFCRRYIAEGTRGIEICSWCYSDSKRNIVKQEGILMDGVRSANLSIEGDLEGKQQNSQRVAELEIQNAKNFKANFQKDFDSDHCVGTTYASPATWFQNTHSQLEQDCKKNQRHVRHLSRPRSFSRQGIIHHADDQNEEITGFSFVNNDGNILLNASCQEQYFPTGTNGNDIFISAEV